MKRSKRLGPAFACLILSLSLSPAVAVAKQGPPPPPGLECLGRQATILWFDGAVATAGNDVIVGTPAADIIDGGGGNDRICAGPGNDDIDGGEGDDRIRGERGNDLIDGAEGTDQLFGDTRLEGAGEDVVVGGPGDDVIGGGRGDDVLVGGPGRDQLLPGADTDVVHGGTATVDDNTGDLILFFDSPSGILFDLQEGRALGNGTDRVTGVEHASGSCFDDVLSGDRETNFLFGGPGDDRLFGRGARDGVQGDSEFSQRLLDRLGLEGICVPRPGDDLLDGGLGIDLVTFYGIDPGYRGRDWGVDVNLTNGRATGQGSDTLQVIELVSGSNSDDVLIGNDANNSFWPQAGADQVHGRGGVDTISFSDLDSYPYGVKEKIVDGSADVSLADGEAHVTWVTESTETARATTSETDAPLTGIESVVGSPFGDVIEGNGTHNFLAGEGGGDDIAGLGGDDVINGGTGEDSLDGGAGARDIADFFLTDPAFAAPICGLLGPMPYAVPEYGNCDSVEAGHAVRDLNLNLDFTDPADEVDTLSGFEGIEGDDNVDILAGDGGPFNELYGLDGPDLLFGAGGSDWIDGGGDTYADTGDAIDGGPGEDNCVTDFALAIVNCEGSDEVDEHPILDLARLILELDRDGRIKRSGA